MSDFVELLRDSRLLLTALVLFGVLPGVALRLIVRIYPKDHPRREELVGELYSLPFLARPLWVAQQFETAISEAIPSRWRALPRSIRRRVRMVLGLFPATVAASFVAALLVAPAKAEGVPLNPLRLTREHIAYIGITLFLTLFLYILALLLTARRRGLGWRIVLRALLRRT